MKVMVIFLIIFGNVVIAQECTVPFYEKVINLILSMNTSYSSLLLFQTVHALA